jgi:hypothetical protein
VFCLTELNPLNSQTLNYAPVAVGIALTYALRFWAISALRWLAEPIKLIAGVPPALYSFFVGWTGQCCRQVIGLHTGREEHRCCGVRGDVRETGVLGEEHGSLNGFLGLLIVEVRKGGA